MYFLLPACFGIRGWPYHDPSTYHKVSQEEAAAKLARNPRMDHREDRRWRLTGGRRVSVMNPRRVCGEEEEGTATQA